MAKGKNTIVVYKDWIDHFDNLSDEEAGQLIKHFFRYVNDLNPEAPNRLIEIAFQPIKTTLKRDLEKWEKIVEKRVESGKKGGQKSVEIKQKMIQKNEANQANASNSLKNQANASFASKNQANQPDSDSDSDSVINSNTYNSKSHCNSYELQNVQNEKNTQVLKNQKPKERKKVAPKKESEIEHWKSIVELWFNFYKSKFIVAPTFKATEGKQLKDIVCRFQTLSKEKDKSDCVEHFWPEDRVLRMFEKFLNNAWSDKWLSEHFLLKNLLSNFDAIINSKSKPNGNQQSTTTGTKKQYVFSAERAIETIASRSE